MEGWFEKRLSALEQLDAYQFTYELNAANVSVKLDANENWHIPRERLRQIVASAAEEVDVRRYPLGCVQELRAAVAKQLRIPEDSIVPTEGLDQGIDLVCQGFLREGDRAVIVGPTYSFYKLRSAFAGAACVEVAMNDDFSLPVQQILEAAGKGGVVFICSPNNPTGNQFRTDDLEQLYDTFPGLIVVDEAYVDFATETTIGQVTQRRNLLVLRTFSKAFGLANLRLGLVIGNPEWTPAFLERVQYPYPISGLAANVALRLMEEPSLVKEGIESLKRERSWLFKELTAIQGVKVLPSSTNFLLLGLAMDYGTAHEELLKRGIATKRVGRVLGLENCIRVTIGTREMNTAFLSALGEVLRNA